MNKLYVRYIVHDVDAAVQFYTQQLGFIVDMHPTSGFAYLKREGLQLLLNPSGGAGAGAAMPDGTQPQPGGWNRFQLRVDDLEADVARLREAGVSFRSDIITSRGGKQILLEDPSGNPIELFEPS